MATSYDAIIIGAGIIGGCTAYELARRGLRTLNLDKLPAAGYGSTGASCAIIRTHYSTLDGAALAYESYFAWDDWPGYLATADERGLAKFVKSGCLVLKTAANGHLRNICRNMDALGIPYEELGAGADQRRACRSTTSAASARPSGPTTTPSARRPAPSRAASTSPARATSTTRSSRATTPSAPPRPRVRPSASTPRSPRSARRTAASQGVTLASGEEIDAPVVVNVAGPHSAKINAMAGVLEGMRITTRALKQEVAHVPFPKDFDFEKNGLVTSDSDVGCYCRPEIGNHILIGSEDPPCDPREWVDPDDYDRNFSEQWQVQVQRVAQRIPTLPVSSPLKGVVDLYDVTEDWIPIYDKSDLAGFYMAIGTSGNQFKNAPVAGAMMAELIIACESGPRPRPGPAAVPPRAPRAARSTSASTRAAARSTPRAAFPCSADFSLTSHREGRRRPANSCPARRRPCSRPLLPPPCGGGPGWGSGRNLAAASHSAGGATTTLS